MMAKEGKRNKMSIGKFPMQKRSVKSLRSERRKAERELKKTRNDE
jgi:hypothetical protein